MVNITEPEGEQNGGSQPQTENNRPFGTMNSKPQQPGTNGFANATGAADNANTPMGRGRGGIPTTTILRGGFNTGSSRGRGGRGGGSFGNSAGGGTTPAEGQQQQDGDGAASEAKPTSGGFAGGGFRGRGGSGGGGSFGARQAEGASGTDFGDSAGGGRGKSATGANTAPLGGGTGGGGRGTTRGGFGGRGGGNVGFSSSRDNTSSDTAPSGGGGFSSGVFGGRGGASGAGFGRGGGGTSFGNRDNNNTRGNYGTGANREFGSGSGGSRFGAERPYSAGQGGDRQGGGEGRRPFGGFQSERPPPRQYASEEERDRESSHVPVDRKIEEIFEEDLKVSENYKTICDEDEECVVTGLPEDAPKQMLDKWEDANFAESVMKNIERAQYSRPRKIQSLTIPLIMDGHDIKGHAETGSGKSAAFLLPIINQIVQKKAKGEFESKRICPYAVIIEPTRELAYQLYDQARKLADGTDVKVSKAYGKFKRRENIREISVLGCDILVGTPGRLFDFFNSKLLEFEKMKVLILDEADQLLEDEFARDLRQISKIEGFPKNEDRQTLLFSATFPPEVQEWANDWMKKDNVMVSNKKMMDANSRVVQKFMNVQRSDKNSELLKMLQKEEEEAKTENPANPAIKRTMVFVKMKRTADVVSTYLNVNLLKSTTINGDRPQELREKALNEFRTGKFNIVVTTDVCARGIDIKDLDHVINLDLPLDYVTYVHRIGRTGRLKEGVATSFFDPVEDMQMAEELVKGCQKAGQEPPEWLVQASEGKLVVEEPANQGWGFGSSFCGGGFGTTAAPEPAKNEKENSSSNAETTTATDETTTTTDEPEKKDGEEPKQQPPPASVAPPVNDDW